MIRRNIQGLQVGEGRVALQKLPPQISSLDVLSAQTISVQPTSWQPPRADLPALLKYEAINIQNVNLVSMKHYIFSMLNVTESNFIIEG